MGGVCTPVDNTSLSGMRRVHTASKKWQGVQGALRRRWICLNTARTSAYDTNEGIHYVQSVCITSSDMYSSFIADLQTPCHMIQLLNLLISILLEPRLIHLY